MRIEHRTEDRPVELDLAHQLRRAECHAGNHIRVPPEVLGRRVENQIRPMQQRLLIQRTEKRVIDRQKRVVTVRYFGNSGDVGQLHRRIRR